jgi:hypothetical protein
MVHSAAANSAATITGLRPKRSEIGPVDGIFVGQQRHHRLHAIEQGEGREAAAEQRQHRTHERRRAFFDVDLLEFSDDIVLHGRWNFMGKWSDSSFHVEPQKGAAGQAMKKKHIAG